MSKIKKVLLMCTAYVLVAALAIGGTIAYLTSEDSDVNVMTLGNVSIEQIEQERNANGELVDFTQAKPALPAVYEGTSIPWASEDKWPVSGDQAWKVVEDNANVVDKFVSVKNTGKSDAFVRTIIAFETGKDKIGEPYMHFVCNDSPATPWNFEWAVDAEGNDITIEIDGSVYYIGVFTYEEALKPGVTTVPNVKQIYLDKTATNEVCAAYGDTFEILVLSQAIQTAGFDSAATALNTGFGVVNADSAAEWFKGMPAPGILTDAIGVNKSTNKSGAFVLADDIETAGDASITSDARYGYGYEYIIRGGVDYTLDLNGKTIAHKAVNKNAANTAFTYLFVANNAGTKLTIDGNGEVYSHNSEGYTCAIQGKDGTLVTVNGGDYQVDNGIAVWAGAGSHIVINGGSFANGNGTLDHELIYSSGGVIDIYGGFFHNADGNSTLNIEDRNRATGFINVYGGTYVNFDPSTGGQDPNNIKVADGYKVVSETQANGDVWYTVVAE